MNLSRLLPAALLALGALRPGMCAAGGAWVLPSDAFYVKFGSGFIHASRYYAPNGDRVPGNSYDELLFSAYGELGLTSRITAIGFFPALKFQSLDGQLGGSAPGDMRLGFKAGLRSGASPIAVSAIATVPTGTSDLPMDASGPLTGEGAFELQSGLHVSRSSTDGRSYGSLYAGYNYRATGLNDEWLYQADVGRAVSSSVWLSLTFSGRHALGEVDPARIKGLRIGVGEGVEHDSFGLEGAYSVAPGMAISLGVQGALRARNLPAGANLLAGLSWQRQP